MTKLLSCPFCGDTDITVDWDNGFFTAWCGKCESEGPTKISKEEAVKAWNIRFNKDSKEGER